jgi:hypothetical protein
MSTNAPNNQENGSIFWYRPRSEMYLSKSAKIFIDFFSKTPEIPSVF